MVIIVRVHLTWHVDCTFFLDWRLIFTHVGSLIDRTIGLSGLHHDHPSLHQGLQEDTVRQKRGGRRELGDRTFRFHLTGGQEKQGCNASLDQDEE